MTSIIYQEDEHKLLVTEHEHDWDFASSGNKIEAYCKNENCPSGTDATHKVSLTLSASDANYSSSFCQRYSYLVLLI